MTATYLGEAPRQEQHHVNRRRVSFSHSWHELDLTVMYLTCPSQTCGKVGSLLAAEAVDNVSLRLAVQQPV